MVGLEYSPTELITSLTQSRKAGITRVSSSGVTAKVLRDLRRLDNRETPTILSILVIEDLAMVFYLPVLSALVIGVLGLTMLVAGIPPDSR